MLAEVELVPYEASPLPEGPYLVFAPHPDDETFGLGGTLLLAAQQGIEVHVAIMTDGALGGSANDLTHVRKQEAQQAIDFLGVKTLHFFDFADRALTVDALSIERVAAYIEQVAPASIFFPSLLEYHPDHRATAFILASAVLSLPKREMCCFSYDISVHGFINRLIDISSVVEKKAQAMDVYLSQLEENQYSDLVLALNRTRAYTLSDSITHAEGLYQFARDELQDLKGFMKNRVTRYWDQQMDAEIETLKADLQQCQQECQRLKAGRWIRLTSMLRRVFGLN